MPKRSRTAATRDVPATTASALPADYDPAEFDWVPILRKPRADGWTPQRQRAFIGELADCGSVATAAQRVGLSASSAYRLRRAPDGRAFASAWDAAMQQAAHALIDAAFERAFNGSEEPVFDRNGRRVGRRFRQSDGLLMFMLRKHFPERYGDLHRDRAPDAGPLVEAEPVAERIAALDPPRPDDPAALMAPDDLANALTVARICDGELPSWQRQDGAPVDRGEPPAPSLEDYLPSDDE